MNPHKRVRIFVASVFSCILILTLIAIAQITIQNQAPTDSDASGVISLETNDGSYNALKNLTWDYTPLIRPEDIPLPQSMNGTINPQVKSLYSPSVIKKSDGYYMAFGVSLYCNAGGGGQIARDSIALAWSPDSKQWVFLKYLIEPDTSTCFAVTPQWKSGAIFQVNDPYMFVDKNIIRVLYTTTEWQPNKNTYGCGNIGITAYDTSFNLYYRNDRFLSGTDYCNSKTTGLSRPSLKKINASTNELWVDSNYTIKSIPLKAIDRLRNLNEIRDRNIIGGDIDTPYLDPSRTIVLYNGGLHNIMGITAQTQATNWTQPWALTRLSGQAWDSWYHSSPFLFSEKNCNITLFFSGMRRESPGSDLPIGTIGSAKPISNSQINFPGCR